jgi:hypothetical protein
VKRFVLKGLIAAVVLLTLGLITNAGAARADIIAYDNAAVAANQGFGNSLGLDFNVNTPILVTALGAFDSGVVGNLAGVDGSGVTVGIYDRTTGTLFGPSVHFTPASFGFQVNGDAFDAIPDLLLPAGFQGSIVAFNDINYNSGGGPNPTSTENTGGGAISFVGGGRFGFGYSYPTIVDGGPTNRYDAGTFQFVGVPEPASLTLLGIGLTGMAGYVLRRRNK